MRKRIAPADSRHQPYNRCMTVIETERLSLQQLTEADDAFILELLNDAAFVEHIGDRGVRTREQAREYLRNGPIASYRQHGFGLYRVALKRSGERVGICGLLKRDTLVDVDIGYALLPCWRGKGLAREASLAVLGHAQAVIGLKRIIAIVSPANDASIRVLEGIGLRADGMIRVGDATEPARLFAWQA
ncbi:MAG: GNAT family N-acetyltransferase [Dokdonella sp.]